MICLRMSKIGSSVSRERCSANSSRPGGSVGGARGNWGPVWAFPKSIAPRFNTRLDLVRVLDYDLMLVPRSLVPAVQSLIRDQRHPDRGADDEGERPLYGADDTESS